MANQPPIIRHRTSKIRSERPVQTPIRNQIAAGFYSLGVILQWAFKILGNWGRWW